MQTDAATPNNTQQQVTGSADGRNMVKSNNAGSCWPTMLRPFAGGVLVVSYSYFSFDAIRSRNTIKSIKFCRVIDISPYYLHFFLLKLLGLLNLYNNDQPALNDQLAIPTPG